MFHFSLAKHLYGIGSADVSSRCGGKYESCDLLRDFSPVSKFAEVDH